MMNYILKVCHFRFFLPALLYIILLIPLSCTNDEVASQAPENKAELERVENKLNAAGFDTSEGFMKYKDGYLVEYDIFMTEKMIDECLNNKETSPNGRINHYITNNLVAVNGTRTLQIFMDPAFSPFMQNEFNTALARYNALNLGLRFQGTPTQNTANISILAFYEESNVLGFSAGFPTSGNPANPISLNTFYFDNNRADAATVIAHEIGHAIGFRHTDFMNRTFSCGVGGNEGDAGFGANHVPGTPTGPSANSWMLACSNGVDRPFTQDDINALQTTYPFQAPPQPIPQTWDVRIVATPNTIQSGPCTYRFGTAWTVCAGTSAGGSSASNGILNVNGIRFNPTGCTWNVLYGPTTCGFQGPGQSPTPITRSISLNPASGSGVQHFNLTFGGASVSLRVEYVYNP